MSKSLRVAGLAVLTSLFVASAFANESAEYIETPISESDREHWSFMPLVQPDLPNVADTVWARTPIDRFIVSQFERRSLRPSPAADRTTLIRRLSFDLLGLPPSPAEIDSFLADESPDAYERLVERLLASPRYGERWAQHWLDLARFAETDGFEHDKVRENAWRYRDWVIDALNCDVGYDEFIRLQLAGDELRPGDPDALRATAFCLSGPDMPDVNSQSERLERLLTEIASTVGSALLGLQFGCAECHDHKYDPISQADFYRLRAIFAPAIQLKKDRSVDVLSESGGKPSVSRLLLRGDWQRPGPVMNPDFPRIANPDETVFVAAKSQGSSGRRAALARWITESNNPLTSRVIVNRIWQHHFGRGLSETPSDFGVMGDEPLHAELLDWMATEFIRDGWSLKSLHRLIVCSAVYQQASRSTETPSPDDAYQTSLERDPQNRRWSRFPRRRLEGETIRDAMLTAAGILNESQHGPGVMPPLPDELRKTLLKDQWNVSANEADHYRRGIYVFARRNLRYPIFEAFDRPDANASCAVRGRSTTAPQSLLMMNSELSMDLARRFADRLQREASDVDGQVTAAFRIAFGRFPTDDELNESRAIIEGDSTGLIDFCLALFNANEFIYVD